MNLQSLQKIAIIIGITIVLNIFFNYGITVFMPEPEYNDYCDKGNVQYLTQETCEANDGEWIFYQDVKNPVPQDAPQGYCDIYERCSKAYDEVRGPYEMKVFTILLVLGLISLLIGFYVIKVSAVSLGLIYGGIISILISAMRSWVNIGEMLRFALIGLVLAIIIYIGYKKTK